MSEAMPGEELVIGNYTVLGRLGAGGMGTVFKARHRSMKRVVALKILSRDTSSPTDHILRFGREPDARPAHGGPTPAGASPLGVTVAAGPVALVDSGEFRLNITLSAEGEAPTPSDARPRSDLKVVLVEPTGFQARIAHKYLQELRIENVVVNLDSFSTASAANGALKSGTDWLYRTGADSAVRPGFCHAAMGHG